MPSTDHGDTFKFRAFLDTSSKHVHGVNRSQTTRLRGQFADHGHGGFMIESQ